jgi:class 3 adenylate cyclase
VNDTVETPGAGAGGPQGERPALTAEELRHRYDSVLALARSGATAFAQKRFNELALDKADAEGQMRIDIGSLAGRIAKDRALACDDRSERKALMSQAANIYEAVFHLTPNTYPLVNVAALRLWAGDKENSRKAAEAVLELLAKAPPAEQGYWHFATLAEAHLLSGDTTSAARAVERAARLGRKAELTQWYSYASTRRQLRQSCRILGESEAFLELLKVPPLIVYTGDRPGPRFRPDQEPALAAAIQAKLEAEESHIGVGSLAAGADILFAEALLARGADLHVVLAFQTDMFIDEMVAPHGARWVERFNRCLARARSVKHATNYGYQGHAAPVRYACRLAMGQAILRARSFDTSAVLLAACDIGTPLAEGMFDPTEDAAFWAGTGRRVFFIKPEGEAVEASNLPRAVKPGSDDHINSAAVLFGDLHGFSSMPESLVTRYAERVLGGIGDVFDKYGTHLLSRNSWGDGIFAQFDNVVAAARCAIDVQSLLHRPDISELDTGVHMSMRIGLHYGPVQRVFDRVQGRVGYMGIHVVQAARIEPIAVPGMIYVSEAFAAALAIDAETGLVCDYLGEVETAKKFGRVPLYELRSRGASGQTPRPT